MMTVLAETNRLMLPDSLAAVVVWLMAAAGVTAWVGAHALRRRFAAAMPPAGRIAMFAGRTALGAAALWLVAQAVQQLLVLATSWPIWPIALLGAFGVETLISLYELERRTVSRRSGLALVCLRVALVLLVVGMLTQPVKSLSLAKKFRRCVAVLVDDSASMHVPETQLTPAEKVRRAEMLGVVDRPYRLERVYRRLSEVRGDIAAQQEWMRTAGKNPKGRRGEALARRAEAMADTLEAAEKTLSRQIETLGKLLVGKLKIDSATHRAVSNLKAALTLRVQGRLKDAVAITDDRDEELLERRFDKLRASLNQAASALVESLPKLQAAGEQVDATFYRSLDGAARKKVDAVARRSRYALARELLLRRGALRRADDGSNRASRDKKSLLERLGATYEVKLFTFASKAQTVDVKQWQQSPSSAPAAADLPVDQQETDLAAALRAVATQLRGSLLVGVVLLTDGRHNTPDRPEGPARDFGVQGTRVCSVALGSRKPPRDAAIASAEPPETVYAGDRMAVKTELKLDGLAGEVVKVVLYDGDKQVADELIRVPKGQDRLRKKIEMAAEPKEAGQHPYRLCIEGAQQATIDDEVFSDNNAFEFTVTVSDDRTKLLLIERRPRWEFRYIKNLFDGRDPTVDLQYVLLEPDEILGQPMRPEVPASASRPRGQAEATALPKDLQEWLKFDVIILGDVSPAQLGPDGLNALGKFVRDRGGTLVAIAGQRFMPHAYAESGIEDLLPVELVRPRPGRSVMDSGDPAFRLALTGEGKEHIITRQHVETKKNEEIWAGVPDLYWRYPGAALKGTTVLAYARPPKPPEYVKKAGDAPLAEGELAALHEFERTHALLTIRRLEPGKVLFVSTDRTWRLRYRVGDTYHHKFWGQVLRWATAEKLPSGTDLVKIGTNRSRYSPRQRIRVRVKIVRPDYSPVISEEVAVNVFAKDKLVLRKKLEYVQNSPGIYTADLGELPSGEYRAELDAPVAKPLLDRDNVEKVTSSFSVAAAAPAEQIELVPDRGLLNRLATLSGGVLVEPSQANQLLDVLGREEHVEPQRRQYSLWDSWPLLVLIVLIATGEWLLRKRVGLA